MKPVKRSAPQLSRLELPEETPGELPLKVSNYIGIRLPWHQRGLLPPCITSSGK